MDKPSEFILSHERYMKIALNQARMAMAEGEVPVGAVIVKDGKLIAAQRNRREALMSPLAHAETLAIKSAARYLGDWRLDGCVLYSTLEPCLMCAGAIAQSRISCVIFGAFDLKGGACGGHMPALQSFSPLCEIGGGILESECANIMKQFFSGRRYDTKTEDV